MALIEIQKVNLEGETIKHVFFLDVIGGDKMFLVTESNRIIILPVYRGCPVQEGTVADLVGDFADYRERMHEALSAQMESQRAVEIKLKEIEDGMDRGQPGKHR